ncbi:MAG: flagellar biosynthesis anti-sigma factor FlgM [Actinomycetota bacterium]|nr:flagellar biosynthesis anti-sigma factor FlgM [Actinomycetota bacterium]
MKISDNQIEKVLQSYVKQLAEAQKEAASSQASPKEAEGKKNEPADTVTIAEKSRELAKAMDAYKKLPNVREEKVKEVKDLIDSGNYDVSSSEIAEKMIYRSIIDKLV